MSDRLSAKQASNVDRRARALEAEQNKVRGVIAASRARVFESDPVDRHAAFVLGIKKCLLSARAGLHADQFIEYLKWAKRTAKALTGLDLMGAENFENLAGIVPAAPLGIGREVDWVASILEEEVESISAFRAEATIVETHILTGKFESALECLDRLASTYGESFWTVELRFALFQLTGGLEQQKAYMSTLREQFQQGLLSFVAYHVSVRNEDKTTSQKYLNDTLQRIVHRTSFKIGVQSYLQFRLLKTAPVGRQAWADILRCEQSSGLIDLYETFVSLIQHVASGGSLGKKVESRIRLACERLAATGDPRILQTKQALGRSGSPLRELPVRRTGPEELLFAGHILAGYKALRKSLRATPADVWQIVYAALALSFSRRRHANVHSALGTVELLASVFARANESPDDLARLQKLGMNFANIPVGRALLSIADQIADKDRAWIPDALPMNLQCATAGPELEHGCIDSDKSPFLSAFWRQYWNREPPPQTASASDSDLIGQALAALRYGQPQEALPSLDRVLEKPSSGTIAEVAELLSLAALSIGGPDDRLIGQLSVYGTRSLANRRLLSAAALLRHLDWEQFRQAGLTIRTCNALHLLWDETGDEKVASWLRFATSQVLKQEGKPSSFDASDDPIQSREMIYFLRYVCVPSVMDVSRVFSSSREVLEERRRVLGSLLDFDPESKDAYQQEIIVLSNRLTVDEGLTIVDKSRIYVDQDAYRQWAKALVDEPFQRYRDLVAAGLGKSDNFDDVVRLLANNPQSDKALFFTPDNQADALLLSMLSELRDGFLTNTTFGFDYFLSKRIRHQSFVGLIRGPLEFEGLITTRETERSDYKPNEAVLTELATLDEEQLAAVSSLLATFSARFDETLATLRDTRLQVRSEEKPSGVFEIPLSAPVLLLVRAIAQSDADASAFIGTSLAVFWGAIDAFLTEARRLIAENTKNALASLIDQLRIDLRSIAGGDPGFVGLDTRLGRASVEVQRNLDVAAGWFVRSDNTATTRPFSLEDTLEIAIESARQSQRAFSADIHREVVGRVLLPAANLPLVTEVIFVALDNVRRHSGLRRPARIDIRCVANVDEEVLEIEVISDAAEQARGPNETKRLEEIRTLIQSGALEKRTRREGGSGFIKLAAMVRQASKGRLEFGFLESGRFRVLVRYSMVVSSEAMR